LYKFFVVLLLVSFKVNAADSAVDPIQVKYVQCMALQEKKLIQEAIPCFESVLEASPTSANALYYLGMLYAQANRYPESSAAFKKVLQLQPDDASAISKLIKVLKLSNHEGEALALAEDAHRRFPEHPGFQVALIAAYQKMNKLDAIEPLRTELFALVARKKYDGLTDAKLYVRDVFSVNDTTVYAIEYFPDESNQAPRYSLVAKFADKKERTYRLHFDAAVQAMGSAAYFVDAYEGTTQSIVTVFSAAPPYEQLKAVVIKDLTAGGKK
jgi:tetratricopeptide (TPR) repeat protein